MAAIEVAATIEVAADAKEEPIEEGAAKDFDANEDKEAGKETKGDGSCREKNVFYCRNEDHGAENPPHRVFLTEEAKLGHLSRNHKCPYSRITGCPFYYEREAELGKHLLERHPVADLDDTCPICQAVVEKEYLERHKEVMHKKCTCCGFWYLGMAELKKHWELTAGTCRPVEHSGVVAVEKSALGELPEALTMANLPNMRGNHAAGLTDAIEIIINATLPTEKQEEARKLISSYSFHQRHIQEIENNRWLAQSQTTQFLVPPSFKYPTTAKERGMDKALDAARVTDLSPYVNKRFDNYLLVDSLNDKIGGYVKQYCLSEQSAVFLFIAHLSGENQDTLRSTYKRHPHDLNYREILQCLQAKYFNIDLKSLRDAVVNLKRAQHEHLLPFYNRAYKLASLAAINFEKSDRDKWVEVQVRTVFYKALDIKLRLEIDNIQSKTQTKMSSATMLDMYISRANLKSNAIDEDDLDTSSDRDTVRAIHRREEPRRQLQRAQRPEPNEGRGQIAEIMRKLDITPETLVTHGRFCWACGAGHGQLNEEEYHRRKQCSMPWFDGTPHECREGIYLMHGAVDCPYKDACESDGDNGTANASTRASDEESDEENGTANASAEASDEEDEPEVNEESGDASDGETIQSGDASDDEE